MRIGKTASFHALGKNQILECLNLLHVLNAKFSVNALLVRAKQHDKAHSGGTRGAAAGVTAAAGYFFTMRSGGFFGIFLLTASQKNRRVLHGCVCECCCDAAGARAASMAFINRTLMKLHRAILFQRRRTTTKVTSSLATVAARVHVAQNGTYEVRPCWAIQVNLKRSLVKAHTPVTNIVPADGLQNQ